MPRRVLTAREQSHMFTPWRTARSEHDLLTGYHDYLGRYRAGRHDPQTLADYIQGQGLDDFDAAVLWDHADNLEGHGPHRGPVPIRDDRSFQALPGYDPDGGPAFGLDDSYRVPAWHAPQRRVNNRTADTVWNTSDKMVLDAVEEQADGIDRYGNYVTPGELASWRRQALEQVGAVRDDPNANPNDRRRAYDLYRQIDRMAL